MNLIVNLIVGSPVLASGSSAAGRKKGRVKSKIFFYPNNAGYTVLVCNKIFLCECVCPQNQLIPPRQAKIACKRRYFYYFLNTTEWDTLRQYKESRLAETSVGFCHF